MSRLTFKIFVNISKVNKLTLVIVKNITILLTRKEDYTLLALELLEKSSSREVTYGARPLMERGGAKSLLCF